MNKPEIGRNLYEKALRIASQSEPDLGQVALLLRQAIVAQNPQAMYALGTWYLYGKPPVIRKDMARGIELLKRAAAADVADASYELAICYETGETGRIDRRNAFKCYLSAAIRGHKQAVFEVSRCLFWGLGVSRSVVQSKIWLKRAEEIGAELEWEPVRRARSDSKVDKSRISRRKGGRSSASLRKT